ncbi:hypothetical protein [Streptomyces ochraceiscleroticus]|uniref:Uncharacterized protein n=1 Tax=Streptomyces ochraceiscleroticus TaxID=47761 RepID=A0ABW1MKW8_9ACTN|nr:hypothetical protein [Streptomyces ochraceiscleroticus]
MGADQAVAAGPDAEAAWSLARSSGGDRRDDIHEAFLGSPPASSLIALGTAAVAAGGIAVGQLFGRARLSLLRNGVS